MGRDIQTRILRVDAARPEAAAIHYAADLLRAGEVVAFPTETVYGLGGDVFQPAALERIFAAKGRPFSDPLIVHIADESGLKELADFISESARRLAEAFWPGPLTLILPRSQRVPSLVTAGLETVAVRMPRHAAALALIRALGSPIAAPSANRFMHISPTTARHVLADLDGRIPLILDGGPCEVGVESTVLNLCSDTPTILRPGGVSLEALRAIMPDIQPSAPPELAGKSDAGSEMPGQVGQLAPGQMLTHYTPGVPLLLFDGDVWAMREAMLAEMRRGLEQGKRVGALVADEDVPAFQESVERGAVVLSLGDAANAAQIANNLFAGLRSLEEGGAHMILCRNFDRTGLGLAIRDRLRKAAGGRIIEV